MPRPARFDESTLLDTALALAADSGPPAVTMAAVAKASGASNGSVYHRFPDHASLLAALWLRTVERFQEGYLDCLTAPEPAVPRARAAAQHVIAWSRENPQQAAVLLHGPDAYHHASWNERDTDRAHRGNQRVMDGVRTLGAELAVPIDRVTLAVVDLPLAVVRRYAPGSTIPPSATELAASCARDLLLAGAATT